MSLDRDLRTLTARLIEEAGLGTYREDGYNGEPWPIHHRVVPPSPDECLTITPYALGAPHRWGIQLRVRGNSADTTSAIDHADLLRVAMHGRFDLHEGDTDVTLLTFRSMASLGRDSAGREEVALNLTAVTSDPGTALDV